MTTSLSIPISSLGPIYSKFDDAPVGSLLAFGSLVATGRGNEWSQSETLIVCMRVETEAGPALLVIDPEPGLIFTRSMARSAMAAFDVISVSDGPAIVLGNAARLVISAISPRTRAQGAQIVPGEVVIVAGEDATRLLVATKFPGYANRMAVIRGDDTGKLCDIGVKTVITLGKLAVERLPLVR